MNWQERIIVDPDILVGKPVVKGTRIAVEFIADVLAQGWTEEEILQSYPGLTQEDVLACAAYADTHQHSIAAAQYRTLVTEITAILYRHDPAGAAPPGAPADEYSMEARRIAARLREAHSYQDVRRIAHEVFVEFFDESAGPESRYEEVAQEIWSVLQQSESSG